MKISIGIDKKEALRWLERSASCAFKSYSGILGSVAKLACNSSSVGT